jgi:hypothetical protein
MHYVRKRAEYLLAELFPFLDWFGLRPHETQIITFKK